MCAMTYIHDSGLAKWRIARLQTDEWALWQMGGYGGMGNADESL